MAPRRRRPHLLSHGRAPALPFTTTITAAANPSSRLTRTTIRAHHTLAKRLSAAQRSGDGPLAAQLAAQLDARGGLAAYQAASLAGQAKGRGGDTSRVLVRWLEEAAAAAAGSSGGGGGGREEKGETEEELRILEVGALSTRNAIGRVRGARVRRIDMRSVERGIEERDFMELELPGGVEEESNDDGDDDPWAGGYDLVSLSLVLNFVPDPAGRGEMLRRTVRFLRRRRKHSTNDGAGGDGGGDSENGGGSGSSGVGDTRLLPALFLVLTAPCVTNSRYLTEERLGEIMGALGYVLVRKRLSSRLAYYLWRWDGPGEEGGEARCEFKKRELRSGKDRNNFCIVLEKTEDGGDKTRGPMERDKHKAS